MEFPLANIPCRDHTILSQLKLITYEDLKTDFLCIKCGDKFVSSKSLEQHKRIIHNHIPKLFTCVICYKNYEFHCQLRSHLSRVHDDSRKTTCPKCSKGFSSKSSLSIHNKKFHPLKPSIN